MRAIDNIAPLDQIREGAGVKSEFFGSDGREKFCAGFIGGIVELFPGMIVPEVFGVFRLQERALMMVEPPGQQRGAGIFEIDDGVFVAVERAVFKGRRGLVRHSGVAEFRVGVDALAIEARKYGGGGGPVEAFVVKTDSNHHCVPPGFHAATDRHILATKVN